MVKIYQQPFAHAGTKQAIPDSSDPQGFVSNEDGFTTDYELPDTDPNYKPIERAEFNGLMNTVTEAVGELQQFGFAKWQPIPWPQGARVVEGGVVYRALNQTSQQPPHADWVVDQPDINLILQPSMTGSITLNGTTDNTVDLTNIVTELELEIGDVIRIDTGAYNKLHTVESITDNSSIIVNYEHAGNKGNGSLKLPDFTGQAAVTRIAKWFNAPLGMGQAWVDVTGSRSKNTFTTNTTGRTISVLISGNLNATVLTIGGGNIPIDDYTGAASFMFAVPRGADYKLSAWDSIYAWAELR
jgi:hypothetical protein